MSDIESPITLLALDLIEHFGQLLSIILLGEL